MISLVRISVVKYNCNKFNFIVENASTNKKSGD